MNPAFYTPVREECSVVGSKIGEAFSKPTITGEKDVTKKESP